MAESNGFQNGNNYLNNKDRNIKRMVFIKAAAEQGRGRTPKEIIQFAQELETEYNKWNEEVLK